MKDTLRHDAWRLVNLTGCDLRTARRWLEHKSVSKLAAYGLSQAAKQLKIRRPPAPPPPEAHQEAS